MFLYANRKACVTCNFRCCIEIQGLLKVTDSCVNHTSGNILETVEDSDTVTNEHWKKLMYGLSNRVNCDDLDFLCDFQRHASVAGLWRCNFLCSSWQDFNWHITWFRPALVVQWLDHLGAMCSRAWCALCAVGSRFNSSCGQGKAHPPT